MPVVSDARNWMIRGALLTKAQAMKPIRLLLIEDNRLLRQGIIGMLQKHRDIKIVAVSGRSGTTVLKIHQLKPNVILLDLGLRSLSSLHVVERVKREFRAAKVVVMDLAPVQGDILQFARAGAAGFILKDATLAEFLATIRAVAEGAKVLPAPMVESLFSQIVEHAVRGGAAKVKEAFRMSKREREVFGLISDGLSNKEIAQKLHVSSYTTKSHVHNIMEKLALHTRLGSPHHGDTNGTIAAIARTESTIAV